jgi:tryptophan-associated transmembrane protein
VDEPRLDASRPSNLRLAAFALTAGGALLMGIGALVTWVTVGIADQLAVQTVTPGTDLSGGLITLVCAVVVLVLVVVSRFVTGTMRRVLSIVVIAAGVLAAAVAGYFIWAAPTHYSPVDDDNLVTALANATGRSIDEVRAALAQVVDQLGGYTHIGPGPWIVLIGSVLVVVGGVLTLQWSARVRSVGATNTSSEPTEPKAQ